MTEHIATVVRLGEYRVRRRLRELHRQPRPRRIDLAPIDAAPPMETWFVCPRSGCRELVPQPGFCKSCKADHAAARVVRKRREP